MAAQRVAAGAVVRFAALVALFGISKGAAGGWLEEVGREVVTIGCVGGTRRHLIGDAVGKTAAVGS